MIPPDASAGFVAAMEDVLETYQKPRDPDRPLVCLDESSKQLIIETRAPIPAKPGQPARHDYEYERNGVANIFMMFSPLEGWRRVKLTDRHAAADYGQVLKELSDTHFPSAEKIVLVQDNLSTHTAASLYAAFPAPEARRLAKRGANQSGAIRRRDFVSLGGCSGLLRGRRFGRGFSNRRPSRRLFGLSAKRACIPRARRATRRRAA